MAEHYQELKYWKKHDVSTVATKVVGLYRHVLAELGHDELWQTFSRHVVNTIQRPWLTTSELVMNWNLFALHFKPATETFIPLIMGDRVVWTTRDPRFVLFIDPQLSENQEYADYLRRANEILSAEAASLDLETIQDPFCLVFPYSEFAGVSSYKVALIDPERE